MAVATQQLPVPGYLTELIGGASGLDESTVAILPDRLSNDGGQQRASFRPETQLMRIALKDAGFDVQLVAPPGARVGTYEEHSADVVLPIVLALAGVPLAVVANLLTSKLQRTPGQTGSSPTVRYREAIVEADGTVTLRELTGPAEEVAKALTERSD